MLMHLMLLHLVLVHLMLMHLMLMHLMLMHHPVLHHPVLHHPVLLMLPHFVLHSMPHLVSRRVPAPQGAVQFVQNSIDLFGYLVQLPHQLGKIGHSESLFTNLAAGRAAACQFLPGVETAGWV
jgi:hypothetical protein